MKSKDIIGIVIVGVIVSVCGILLYSQIAPAPKENGTKVTIPQEVTVPLSSDTDKTKMIELKKSKDFSSPQRCIEKPEACDRGGVTPI